MMEAIGVPLVEKGGTSGSFVTVELDYKQDESYKYVRRASVNRPACPLDILYARTVTLAHYRIICITGSCHRKRHAVSHTAVTNHPVRYQLNHNRQFVSKTKSSESGILVIPARCTTVVTIYQQTISRISQHGNSCWILSCLIITLVTRVLIFASG